MKLVTSIEGQSLKFSCRMTEYFLSAKWNPNREPRTRSKVRNVLTSSTSSVVNGPPDLLLPRSI